MEFFKKKTQIDFLGLRKWTALMSALLFSAALLSLMIYGLNWGLDFTGGTQIQLQYTTSADLSQIRTQLNQVGFGSAVVQSYGTSHDVLIGLQQGTEVGQQQLTQKILNALPGATLSRIESLGPEVGRELATKGMLAVLIAMLGTMVYIALRFEYRFAVSAALALVHDPILILGFFSFFHLEFNMVALAAILAVIGYSLNDTIVIFDRVRENFRKIRKTDAVEIMNLSINQTLSRTLMTSGATLSITLALFIFGGEMIHNFATALMIGIIVGTYSSIYVAGALAIAMGLNREDLLPTAKSEIDLRP